MTVYKILSPLLNFLGKKSFYVTVTRNTEAEVADMARLSGFEIESRSGDFYFFKKIKSPSIQVLNY